MHTNQLCGRLKMLRNPLYPLMPSIIVVCGIRTYSTCGKCGGKPGDSLNRKPNR